MGARGGGQEWRVQGMVARSGGCKGVVARRGQCKGWWKGVAGARGGSKEWRVQGVVARRNGASVFECKGC